MEENQPNPNRRWHDNRADLSLMIDLLEHIPKDILPLITEALTQRADQDFKISEILGSLKSLGPEKIMALHQSRKKRRSYDQDPHTHKIAHYFYVIPEAEQETFATRFLEFTGMLVEYMANCESFSLEPQESELRKMRDLFVDSGENAVRDYLHELHRPYYEMLLADPSEPIALTDPAAITQTDQGMLLREKPE